MNTNTPTTAALSRTWETVTTYTACGEDWGTSTHTVTLSRPIIGGELSATINGQACEVSRAVRLLQNADTVTKLSEILPTEPAEVAALIGKPAARLLHVELGRLGYRTSASHYDLAAAVLGRDVTSLAALTAEEAALTRSYAYGQLGLETGSVAA